jgi:hypothetical protein
MLHSPRATTMPLPRRLSYFLAFCVGFIALPLAIFCLDISHNPSRTNKTSTMAVSSWMTKTTSTKITKMPNTSTPTTAIITPSAAKTKAANTSTVARLPKGVKTHPSTNTTVAASTVSTKRTRIATKKTRRMVVKQARNRPRLVKACEDGKCEWKWAVPG